MPPVWIGGVAIACTWRRFPLSNLCLVLLTIHSLILAVGGYLPGLALCRWLYGVTQSATMLPMRLSAQRAAVVLGLTVLMCWVSGLIAIRKLRAADPAEIF